MNNALSRRSFIIRTLRTSLIWALSGFTNTGESLSYGESKPNSSVKLADFGGFPGAPSEALLAAFEAAFIKLKTLGGGVLLVSPGDYDFGSYSKSSRVIDAADLKDVVISAYGARFIVTSKVAITPFLFCFHNPNNVTLSGANFIDFGFNKSAWLAHNRWGMYCVSVDSITECNYFKLVDCLAQNVTGLYVNDSRSNKYKVKNVIIENCRVTNAYYGVDALYHGKNLSVRNLICQDVRRGFISFGSTDVDIDIKLHCTAYFLGSNGFISLVCEGESVGDVNNVRIKLDVSGVESHSCLVHFYHQQDDSPGAIKNVMVFIKVNQLTTKAKNASLDDLNIFVFDHELPNATILRNTTRIWDQITLTGQVKGNVSGKIISAPTKSKTLGTLILDDNIYTIADISFLKTNFKVNRLNTN